MFPQCVCRRFNKARRLLTYLLTKWREEDRIVIQYLRQNQNYSAKRFLREFPDKTWTLGGLSELLRKIDGTGSCKRQAGSGRPRTARSNENIQQVQDLALSLCACVEAKGGHFEHTL